MHRCSVRASDGSVFVGALSLPESVIDQCFPWLSMSPFTSETRLGIQLLTEGLCCLLKPLQPRTLGNKTGQALQQLACEIDRLRRTLQLDEQFVIGCPIVPTPETEAVSHISQGLIQSLSQLEWSDCPSSGALSKSLGKLRQELSRVLR